MTSPSLGGYHWDIFCSEKYASPHIRCYLHTLSPNRNITELYTPMVIYLNSKYASQGPSILLIPVLPHLCQILLLDHSHGFIWELEQPTVSHLTYPMKNPYYFICKHLYPTFKTCVRLMTFWAFVNFLNSFFIQYILIMFSPTLVPLKSSPPPCLPMLVLSSLFFVSFLKQANTKMEKKLRERSSRERRSQEVYKTWHYGMVCL